MKEKCPKCGSNLAEITTTTSGRQLQRCSTGSWNAETKKSEGCDYVEWINGTTKPLDEDCPTCGKKLVLFTTNAGKRAKKCSTSGWDSKTRTATGCTYIEWLKPGEYETYDAPEPPEEDESLPPEPAS